jgi:hypothetical protein
MEDNIKGIYPYTPIIWKKCDITGKYYHNKTSEGSQRKSSPYAKDIKKIYYYLSKFKFNVNLMPELFDLPLIEQYGWYVCRDPVRPQLIQNTGGVSRDHRYSIAQGIIDKVHPLILSHPANCSIVLHKDNKRKLVGCDITVAELVKQILYFDNAKQNFKNHQIILDLIYNDQIFLVDFDILRKLV